MFYKNRTGVVPINTVIITTTMSTLFDTSTIKPSGAFKVPTWEQEDATSFQEDMDGVGPLKVIGAF